MADDKKYTQLPLVGAITPTDIAALADVPGDTTYAWTFSQLLTFLAQYSSTGANISFGTGSIPSNLSGNDGDVYIKTDTGQFAQKASGVWSVVYTIVQGVIGSTIYYGAGTPASGTGINGDTYLQTAGGIFYTKITGAWTAQFTMASGPAGPRGNSVLNGVVDPIVTDGTNGDFFLNTATSTLFGPKASGVWPGTGTVIKGLNGNTILNGTSNPSNSLGNNGDFYLNTSNYVMFGPKASGVWPAGVSLIFNIPNAITIPFSSGGTNPFVVSNWVSTYFPTYNNGKFLVQVVDGSGNLQDRPDISITRIINRSGAPVQTGISMDFPSYQNGQIVVEFSNFNLI